MPTIDSIDIIRTLLENNGVYPGDPRCYQISSYTNTCGSTTFHVAYSLDDVFSLYRSPYCNNCVALWERNFGLTIAGKDLLKRMNNKNESD